MSNAITCALCALGADLLETRNYGAYKRLRCSACGEFAITDAAAERVAGSPQEYKDSLKRKIAAAEPEWILLIITEPAGSGGNLKDELVQRRTMRP